MHDRSPIPLLVPDMPGPEALMPYLWRMHESRQYSNFGPLVREFEAHLWELFRQGAPGPVALTTVSSATTGLELVLSSLGLRPGARVLLPALTFVATATVALRLGLVPVLADVDPESWLLTPDIARRALASTPFDAVMPVASFGAPQHLAGWQAFERQTGLPVVVDAAPAFGSQAMDASSGTVVISLHATKSFAAGEGGIVVSMDAELVRRVREGSNFGINLDPAASMPIGSLASIGTNAKLSEYHAAVALAALETWDARVAARRALYWELRGQLDEAAGGRLRWQAGNDQCAPSLLCVRLPSAEARARLEQACAGDGIGTRRWYQPLLTSMPALTGRCVALPVPHAGDIAQDLVGLPFFPGMLQEQRQRIAGAVRSAMR
ncbi:MAG: DegT/DnrJ/EryC1/StrS family aminotransferase [Pseudomonadota bacterium]